MKSSMSIALMENICSAQKKTMGLDNGGRADAL